MIDNPVFIAGLDRTGKTPMRIAIESMAPIAMSRRAELWTYHLGRHGSLERDDGAKRAVDALLRDRHVAALVEDADALLAELLSGPRTYPRLFALVGRQHARQSGRSRWGDQTALLERRVPEILGAFERASIVHMIRDPRDRYAAARRAGGIGRSGVGGAVEEWLESIGLAERHAATWPARYLIVRFEDLATGPVATMARVMRLIGEQSTPTPAVSVPVSPELAAGIGLHADLPRRAVALIESRCGGAMARHGYQSVLPTLSATERLGAALVDRPMSAVAGMAHRLRSRPARRRLDRAVIGR